MNFKVLTLGLFSLSAISPMFVPAFTPSAMACVAVDVNTQVAVEDKDAPRGEQNNNSTRKLGENCGKGRGGRVVNRTRQVCTSGTCNQNRNVRQEVDGDPNDNSGIDYPVVEVDVDTQVNPRVPRRSRR